MLEIFAGINFIALAEFIASFVVVIVACYLIPFIKKSIPDKKYDAVMNMAYIVCGAAEQLAKANGWNGEEKKKYVFDMLKKHGFKFDDDELDAIIESTVFKITELCSPK